MIDLQIWKKQKKSLTCKEATKMVMPYIQDQLCDEELRAFVPHIQECADCREELETYYIVYKGLMQLDEQEELPMNIIEALNDELENSNSYLRNLSLFYVVSEILKWLVNISCGILLIDNMMNLLWRI